MLKYVGFLRYLFLLLITLHLTSTAEVFIFLRSSWILPASRDLATSLTQL